MEKLTEKEIQKILSTDIEQLLNNPEYADLLNKIPATVKASREAREKEMKRILITGLEEMSNNPEFKEAFSHPVEDLAGADPSCEEVLKGVWKVFKKLEGCHSGELKVSGKSIISL
jgi:hypothetical protein